ncbi:tetratricopeptide repeat protein [Streptomyces sp. CB01249]|uniref:tetratricopeptide repeat protein n=1 Tax=Streptomyces sp. CB01249 TaxID=1703929 RepID=UPI00094014A9|nr:tetratricopeptide repeat protein [Streptomyces sp. CB01249]
MFDRLTSLLGRAGVDLSTEELLDVLWIAEVRRRGGPEHEPPPGPEPDTRPVRPLEPEEAEGDHDARRSGHDLPVLPEPEPERAEPQGLYAPAAAGPAAGTSRPVAVTGVRSLEAQRALNRSMRPLRRTVASRTDLVLDETATVDRMAESALPEPVMRPRPERWLSAVLVVDDGPSMVLWQRYAAEVRALLESQGAFHDIRVHGLDSSGGPGPLLHARPFARGLHPPAVLRTDSVRPTLVLVVSDMVGPAWRSGAVPALLRGWARKDPVAILQPLPERMWPEPGGHPAERLLVRSRHPAAPGRALRVSHPVLPPELVSYDGTPVPVLEAAEGQLASWVSLLTEGDSRAALPVLMIPDSDPVPGPEPATPAPEPPPTPEERFRRFREAASPEGRRLAGALASVTPLTLPVMRVVHEAHRATGGTFHRAQLAEVFLGGLLRRTDQSTAGDGAEYAFLPGVADLLLDTVRTSVALDTADRVAAYLLERSGPGPDFRARLSGDGPGATTSLPDHAGPFAAASPELLRRLGLTDARRSDPRAEVPEPEPVAEGPGGPEELYVMERVAPALTAFARRLLADPVVPGIVDQQAERISERSEEWFPETGWSPVAVVPELARRITDCRLRDHQAELLGLIREVLEGLLTDTSLITRNARGYLAIALSGLGETTEAVTHMRAIISMSAKAHGAEHRYTLNARRYLHEMFYDDGWYAEAEEEGRPLLETFDRLGAEADQADHTQLKKHQAYALRGLGRHREAEVLLRSVLAWENDPENGVPLETRLLSRSWFATVLEAQGRYQEAENELRSGILAMEASEEVRGGGAVQVLDGLADLLVDSDRHEEAEPFRRATVEASERHHGPNALISFRARRDLINLLRLLDRSEEARTMVEVLEPSAAARLGESHRETLLIREARALVYAALKEYDEALLLYRTVLEQVAALGDEAPRTSFAMRRNFGTILSEAGRLQEAEQVLRSLLADELEEFGRDDPSAGTTMYRLVLVLEMLHEDDEALAVCRELLVIEERTLPEWSLSKAKTWQRMAVLLARLGQHKEAAGQLGLAYEAHVRAMEPDAVPALSAGYRYGVALTAAGRHQEAADILTSVVEGRRTRRGEAHPDTLRSRQRLGDAFAALGLADRARAEWTAVRDIASRELGEDHKIVRTAIESLAAPGAPPTTPLK